MFFSNIYLKHILGDCIPSSWTCDGHVDCEGDNSDEDNCDSTKVCQKGLLKCRIANICYLASKACDGEHDCPDHSDETDCANRAPTETGITLCQLMNICYFI